MVNVVEILEDAANLYSNRNQAYADNYHRFGSLMKAIFPDGITNEMLHSNEFGVFVMMLSKFTRIVGNDEWHLDSSRDLIVYSAMMTELIESSKA
jgi:hypothetical protein